MIINTIITHTFQIVLYVKIEWTDQKIVASFRITTSAGIDSKDFHSIKKCETDSPKRISFLHYTQERHVGIVEHPD
jgi:hypothetical protein